MRSSYFFKQLFGACIFFSLLFISAGRINYWQGWIYVALGIFMIILNYTLFSVDDELLKERSKPGLDAKPWDKTILGLSFLIMLAMFVTAGLDSGRYHWSPEFPLAATVLGAVLTATGQLLFLIAQKQNKFFSSTVRIQQDRGHVVCDSGLYGFVRHPAYLGSFIQALGFPLLFGSLYSIIPVSLTLLLLITRTALEDKTLRNELIGYEAYSRKVRFRLIPMIW